MSELLVIACLGIGISCGGLCALYNLWMYCITRYSRRNNRRIDTTPFLQEYQSPQPSAPPYVRESSSLHAIPEELEEDLERGLFDGPPK